VERVGFASPVGEDPSIGKPGVATRPSAAAGPGAARPTRAGRAAGAARAARGPGAARRAGPAARGRRCVYPRDGVRSARAAGSHRRGSKDCAARLRVDHRHDLRSLSGHSTRPSRPPSSPRENSRANEYPARARTVRPDLTAPVSARRPGCPRRRPRACGTRSAVGCSGRRWCWCRAAAARRCGLGASSADLENEVRVGRDTNHHAAPVACENRPIAVGLASTRPCRWAVRIAAARHTLLGNALVYRDRRAGAPRIAQGRDCRKARRRPRVGKWQRKHRDRAARNGHGVLVRWPTRVLVLSAVVPHQARRAREPRATIRRREAGSIPLRDAGATGPARRSSIRGRLADRPHIEVAAQAGSAVRVGLARERHAHLRRPSVGRHTAGPAVEPLRAVGGHRACARPGLPRQQRRPSKRGE